MEGRVVLFLAVALIHSVYAQVTVPSRCNWDLNHGFFTWSVAGEYSWVVPEDVNYICVQMWGAGGGGSGSYPTTYVGGTSGTYASKGSIKVTPGASCTIKVGAGGDSGSYNLEVSELKEATPLFSAEAKPSPLLEEEEGMDSQALEE